jgi:hypothetical protein
MSAKLRTTRDYLHSPCQSPKGADFLKNGGVVEGIVW